MRLYLIIFCLISNIAFANNYNWQRLSGEFKIKDSKLTETQAWVSPWKYYELININSVISLKPVDDYSSIDFDFSIHDRHESPAEFSVSFAVRSPYKKWFYHIYSIKLSGGFWGINKVSLIHSDMKDKCKRYATKNNIFIKELKSNSCSLRYGKTYKGCIMFNKDSVSFYIDGEKILEGKMPSEDHSGRIALSTKNTKVTIDKVQVKNGMKIVFEDDFNSDTIYVRKARAGIKRVPKK